MKILYFTNIPAPYRVSFFNQINMNNDLTVLFDYKKELDRNENWFDNNNYNFKTINLKKIGFFQLNKVLSKQKFDIIVIGTYASLNGAILNILLRIKKIKFFINADGGFVNKKDSLISKTLKTYFLSTANYYLSTGQGTNKYLTYYGAKKSKIYVYPFSSLLNKDLIDKPIKYIDKLKLRRECGYNYKKLFVSVGSFIHRKGYDIFLDSLSYIDSEKVGFIIIGGGIEKDNYIKYMKTNKIKNVHFIDFCSKEEIFNYYKMSDVFFFPSREDIWGLVINEAMACGLPIISSNNVLASQELLHKDNLYNYEQPIQLAKRINKYLVKSNKELYSEGQKNIDKIKQYTIEKMVNKHVEVFKKVSNSNKKKNI